MRDETRLFLGFFLLLAVIVCTIGIGGNSCNHTNKLYMERCMDKCLKSISDKPFARPDDCEKPCKP